MTGDFSSKLIDVNGSLKGHEKWFKPTAETGKVVA